MPTKRNKRNGPTRALTRGLPQGLSRTRDLEATGASRPAIRRMVGAGQLRQVARGLYAPAGFDATEHRGLAAAAALVPEGVVCLLSALQFHRLGTQAPFEVWLAIGTKARKPTVADPPLRIVRFSERALHEGVETRSIEGVVVRVTTLARTVVDCFKYRNKIGLDVALEALREYRRARRSIDDLTRAAQVVRVSNVMRPYLEAVLA
jgi:predicted transcriptional regulator of viral defense system